jgi:hypothetical protein
MPWVRMYSNAVRDRAAESVDTLKAMFLRRSRGLLQLVLAELVLLARRRWRPRGL